MAAYEAHLKQLESQNKKRLLQAWHEQQNVVLNPAPGQSGDQQAAAIQGQE